MEASDRVSESWFVILLHDTRRDPDRGQILTTTLRIRWISLPDSKALTCTS